MNYTLEELSIEITNVCHMRCLMCSSGSGEYQGPIKLQPEKIKDLIREARGLGATTLSLSGGDPLTDRINAMEYIRLAEDLGYEEILFYTSGAYQLFDNKIIGMSTHYMDAIPNKATVIFSLHSHVPEVNDYIMQRVGARNLIVSLINSLRFRKVKTQVHMVPMLPNWDHVHDVRDLCKEYGVEKLSLLRFVPQTRGRTNNDKLGLGYKQFSELQKIIDEELNNAIHPVKLRAGCPIEFRHTVIPSITEKQHPCHAGKDLMLVRPNGDVHPCAAWKTLPKQDNVFAGSLEYIWKNSPVLNELRHFHEEGWRRVLGQCAHCTYVESCKAGCPAQRLHNISMYIQPATLEDLYWAMPDPLCPVGVNWLAIGSYNRRGV